MCKVGKNECKRTVRAFPKTQFDHCFQQKPEVSRQGQTWVCHLPCPLPFPSAVGLGKSLCFLCFSRGLWVTYEEVSGGCDI